MESAVGSVVWPIFIFFMIFGGKYIYLGSVTTFSLIFSSIFIFVIGRFSDKNRGLALKLGVTANALVWLIRTSVKMVSQVFVIDALYGIAKVSKDIPFDALSYDKAAKGSIVKFTMFREITSNLGSSALFVIMIFIADLTNSFTFGGVLGSLLQLLL